MTICPVGAMYSAGRFYRQGCGLESCTGHHFHASMVKDISHTVSTGEFGVGILVDAPCAIGVAHNLRAS